MRERIEDLGRISVMVSNLCETEIFELLGNRAKYACDMFFDERTDEQREEIIHKMAYGLEELHSKLYECLSIANGTDDLNSSTL